MRKAIIGLFAAALVFAGSPADAATKAITVKTDSMPTTFTFEYKVRPPSTQVTVSCLKIRTGHGRDRIITLRVYEGNKYISTPMKDRRVKSSRTTACYTFSAGTYNKSPQVRITVQEDLIGPNAVGRGIMRLY